MAKYKFKFSSFIKFFNTDSVGVLDKCKMLLFFSPCMSAPRTRANGYKSRCRALENSTELLPSLTVFSHFFRQFFDP